MNDIKQMESLLSTRIPLVVIESHEEQKVINLMERVAALNSQGFYVWNLTHGLRRWNGGEHPYNTQSIVDALRHIENSPQNGVAAQSGTAPPPVVNQAYPGPDRTKDRIGWIAWKLANKRSLSVGQISRACPEAATVATDVEEVHRSRDERLVEIARLGKAGAITPDEFHMAEKTIGQDFVRGLQALVGPVARSESCFAYLRQLDGAR